MTDIARTRGQSDVTIIREPKLAWALAATTAIIALLSAYLMREGGIIEQESASDCIIFCTIIAFGSLLRLAPGMVELRLDTHGLTARDLFSSNIIAWRDVVGPFTVVETGIGKGISFTSRSHPTDRRLFRRHTLYNTYGFTPSGLAEILNQNRRKFLTVDDLKGTGQSLESQNKRRV